MSALCCVSRTAYLPLCSPLVASSVRRHLKTIFDRTNGKSVPGFAQAGILRDIPFAKEYPAFDSSELGRGNRVQTAAEDTFRIVITPGPVLLMGGFDSRAVKFIEYLKYSGPTADAKYPQYFHKSPPNWLEYHPFRGGRSPVQGNFCKVLDIKPRRGHRPSGHRFGGATPWR